MTAFVFSKEMLDSLWENGLTVTRRMADPTNFRPDEIPAGRAYQWMHLEHDRIMYTNTGWAPVMNERHPGRFAPWGEPGQCTWNDLGLFDKPKAEVEAELAANAAKAHQNVADAVARMTENGFTGSITMVTDHPTGRGVKEIAVGDTKTFENVTKIPREMMPYISQIFDERDRLCREWSEGSQIQELKEVEQKYESALRADPATPKWPLLHSLVLPVAIENIRKFIREKTGDNDGAPCSLNTD